MHKILLVEDDPVIRQQVGKMLSEWGFEVVMVEDFMEVLTLFVQSEPSSGSYGYWIFPCLMAIIGARKSARFPKFLLCFCPPRDQAMDIVMAINMGSR